MCGVNFVATVCSARPYHANRRPCRDHRTDLHTRRMRSEKPSIGQIKSIRIVAGGMIRGSIERVKTVPFGLYIGTIGQSKPQPAENSDGTVLQKGQRMHAADPKR